MRLYRLGPGVLQLPQPQRQQVLVFQSTGDPAKQAPMCWWNILLDGCWLTSDAAVLPVLPVIIHQQPSCKPC
jgi:hypothetical protein